MIRHFSGSENSSILRAHRETKSFASKADFKVRHSVPEKFQLYTYISWEMSLHQWKRNLWPQIIFFFMESYLTWKYTDISFIFNFPSVKLLLPQRWLFDLFSIRQFVIKYICSIPCVTIIQIYVSILLGHIYVWCVVLLEKIWKIKKWKTHKKYKQNYL